MSKLNNPHDKFIHSYLQYGNTAQEFFKHNLPVKIRDALDLNTLKSESTSYVDETLKQSFQDFVYSCNAQEHDTKLVLLMEHQSTAEPLMSFRVYCYLFGMLARIQKETGCKKLPAVYALVFYTGERTPYPYSMNLNDCFDDPLGIMQDFLQNSVPLVDINQLDDQQLKQQRWIGPAALAMKHIRDPDIGNILIELLQLVISTTSDLRYADQLHQQAKMLLNYMLSTGNVIDVDDFLKQTQELPQPLGDEIMTAAEKLEARGEARGEVRGKAEEKRGVAMNMIKEGCEPQLIARVTGLQLAAIQALKAEAGND